MFKIVWNVDKIAWDNLILYINVTHIIHVFMHGDAQRALLDAFNA